MKGETGRALRGLTLLRSSRFGVMEEEYLEENAKGMEPEQHREWAAGLVGEALRAKAAVLAKVAVEVGQLGATALTCWRGRGLEWGWYCEGGGGRRLQGHLSAVRALMECEGRMCSGSNDGGRFGYRGWICWRRRACC